MGLCMFAGLIVGDLLGLVLGISANIGGIGFAMLFLVIVSQKLVDKGLLSKPAEQGVGFWNAMYIPIVVAMSANQNVIAALKGGPVALIAGVGAVFIGFLLIKRIICKQFSDHCFIRLLQIIVVMPETPGGTILPRQFIQIINSQGRK